MTNSHKFIPDKFQAIGLVVLGLVVELGLTLPSVVTRTGLDNPDTQNFAHQLVSGQVAALSGNGLVSDLVIVALWGGIGFIVVLVTWILLNFLIQLRNEAVIQTTYTNKGSIISATRKAIEHFAAGLFLLAGLVAFLFGLEVWAKLGNQGVLEYPQMVGLLDLSLALVGLIASIFVVNVLWRITSWVAAGRPPA